MTLGLWTQMWGLAYGEFEGSPRQVYVLLFAGMSCYVIGASLVANIW